MNTQRMLWIGGILAAIAVPSANADQAAFAAKAKGTNGLVGYWAFEGNYEDLSGKGNNAKAVGDQAQITFCPGVKGGQGAQIKQTKPYEKGKGQFITVPAPVGSVFDAPNVTVLVWTNVASTPEADVWDNILDRTSLWYIETQWKEQEDGSLKLYLVNRIYDPENPNNGGTGQVRSLSADTPVALTGNAWHLIGFSYDGQQIISYVDGKEIQRQDYDGGIGPTSATPAPNKNNFDLNWGLWDQEEDWANACFDDTVYYNRALTADEVKALYDSMLQ